MLEVENLNIFFNTRKGKIHAVRDISFSISEGETLGFVGESGCGKSITNYALMGLLAENASTRALKLNFLGHDLLTLPEAKFRKMRGKDITMIFQDPMSALNPSFTVGQQIMETLKVHGILEKAKRKKRAIELLEQVGISDPEKRLKTYPHELSGGMCQRVMIAGALALRPKLLIADEPTTALDVTIQAQILKLLKDLQKEYHMSLILVSHDIGVVKNMTDNIQVMYAGEIVESGITSEVFNNPKHPYTQALIKCLPEVNEEKGLRSRLPSLKGIVPNMLNRSEGCQFYPRCSVNEDKCTKRRIVLKEVNQRKVRCIKDVSDV